MKGNLLIYALLGVVGFVLWQQHQAQATAQPGSPSANPSGGETTAAPDDLVSTIFGFLKEGAKLTNTILQNNAKNA